MLTDKLNTKFLSPAGGGQGGGYEAFAEVEYNAHKVETIIQTITVSALVTEILDKLKTYEAKIFTGKYTYIIFVDCKYILNNNFFQNKILPLWQE